MGIAAALGLLQGITEFLPISSSGHLATFAFFYEVPEMSLALIVLLHGATLLAILLVFGKDLLDLFARFIRGLSTPNVLFKSDDGMLVTALVVASLPTGFMGLLFRDLVESLAKIPWVVGVCYIGTAIVVFSTRYYSGTQEVPKIVPALLIGMAQGLSTLPGLSRSGLTIACAMALGLKGPAAFRFSFLLSIPVITGATLLEIIGSEEMNRFSSNAWIAAFIAFLSGYISLRFLRQIVSRGHFWWFACYLIPLGTTLLILDTMSTLGK